MMRKALIFTVALTFGLVGCSMRPGNFVPLPITSLGSVGTEAATTPGAGPSQTAAVQYGTLQLAVRWPELPSGYQTALIPTTTNTLTVKVTSGSTILGETSVSRLANQATATATMSLKAGNNLALQVLAYHETVPVPDTASPVARYDGNVNIVPSQKTAATIQLSPLFPPTITGLSTNVGVTGDYVTITGTNFGTGSVPVTVAFNGYLSDSVTRLNETSLKAKLPPGVPTGYVVVTADGVSSPNGWVLWVPNTLPISSVKENWDPTPASDRMVRFGQTMQYSASPTWIYKNGDTLNYGTPPLPTWQLSNAAAGTIDPSGLFTATRSYEVTNVSAALGSLNSATQSVTLVADAPVIGELAPTNAALSSSFVGGPQSVVTINGSGFGNTDNSTLQVYLGTTQITNFTRLSDSQLRFTLPSSGVGTGQVKVVSYGATSTNKPTFQVIQSLNVSPTGITVNVPVGGTQQYTVSATDTLGNPVASPSVTWSVNSAAATISATGLLTALDYGSSYPVAQTGALQTWGASVLTDYTYNVWSGAGSYSNTVPARATSTYYSQSFTLSGTTTLKAVDVGVVPDGTGPFNMEIRGDAVGAPGAVIMSTSANVNANLSGHVYVLPTPVTLSAGTYHLIFKIPANTLHYVYWYSGGGTGVAYQSDDSGLTWVPINTVPPNSPNALFFRLGE